MEQFNNKYRNASARAPWWDYANAAAYFITVCTKDRNHFFGEITDGKMQLSPTGILADVLWYEIRNHAKNIELGEFVVMPNHIHGILILNGNELGNGNDDNNVGTRHALFLCRPQNDTVNNNFHPRFRNPGKNTVSSIIGGYKSAVTKHANRLGLPNGWQTRFHDHIIRNDDEYQRIANYIVNNPINWKEDKFHP